MTTATQATTPIDAEPMEQEHLVVDLNMIVPPEQQQLAVLFALEERDSNAPAPGDTYSLAVAQNRLWAVGKRLRVRFLDARSYPDSEARIRAVMDAAREWTRYANLTLALSEDADAELRVAFSPAGGCWSYIGTDAKTQPSYLPTINLSVVGEPVVPADYAKYVLHEFGHAIGCIHEHQTPAAGINWNMPVVYNYYWRHFGWDTQKVDFNIFHIFAQASSNHATPRGFHPVGAIESTFTKMDPDSIMVYPIPKAHTLDGYEVNWQGCLSEIDKQFIRSMYP